MIHANIENKFYKVHTSGYSLTIATFYNPITKESFSKKIWDIDDDRLLWDEDIQELYNMPIDKEVQRMYYHHDGKILDGDIVKVVKGRKIPIGYIGKVEKIKPFYDKYKRWQADYIYFVDGKKTNINNCVLIEAI